MKNGTPKMILAINVPIKYILKKPKNDVNIPLNIYKSSNDRRLVILLISLKTALKNLMLCTPLNTILQLHLTIPRFSMLRYE
jgi:hypothetical protein